MALSIRSKLTVAGVAPIVCLALVAFFVIVPMVRTEVHRIKEAQTRDMVDVALGVLRRSHRLEREGDLTTQEAQAQAIDTIRAMTFGPELQDYYWIQDHHPRIIMHPFRPDLEGTDVSQERDAEGQRLFIEMVETAQEDEGGYVEYHWQYYGQEDRIEPKLSYVAPFEPWGWIVGTGVYIHDIEQIMADTRGAIGFWIVTIALVTSGMMALYAWELSRPTQRVTHVLTGIASDDLSREVTEYDRARTDELGEQARALYRMRERLGELLHQKELLLKESHHRVKNNMQLIRSILHLQADEHESPCKEVLEEAGTRAKAMMVLYDRLYRSEHPSEMSLREFLPPLLQEVREIFRATVELHIDLDVEDLVVPPKLPSPLGIILTELITNSVKHGFTHRGHGWIRVSAAELSATSQNVRTASLVYEDGDGGTAGALASSLAAPEDETPPTFGLRLIRELAAQIEATLEADEESGRVTLRFPL